MGVISFFQRLFFFFLILFCSPLFSSAQDNQVIRGKILDINSQQPIKNAEIELMNINPPIIDFSQVDGSYRLEEVPVGRQRILIRAEGYEELMIPGLNITAGKEAVLIIKLEEQLESDIAIVEEKNKPRKTILRNEKMRAVNPMSLVSVRSFTMDEVRRYAGGINDPARLVTSFAGLFNTDDSQNYIISRGNSPFGIRYFVEGVPMSNPNHFHTLGNTGSPLAMINPNMLSNSDFITSVFSAEYGSAFSGVFDLHFREGNNQKHEFTAQVGLLGLEAAAEGPIKRNKSSYVFNYRYSLFALVQALGVGVGTNSLPTYQDLSFKLNFPSAKMGEISIFGMGGYAAVDILSENINPNDIFAERNRNLYNRSASAMVGVKHKINLGKQIYLHSTLSSVYMYTNFDRDSVDLDGNEHPFYVADEQQLIPGLRSYVNSRINRKMVFRGGINSYLYRLNINNRFLVRDQVETYYQGNIWDFQAFAEMQFRFNSQWKMNIGLFGDYMTLNERTNAVEPRFALVYQPNLRHRFGFGYGLHSKYTPFVTAFYQEEDLNGNLNQTNRELGFIRSHQTELSYFYRLANDWRFKSEFFGQYLFDIPVEQTPSSYSIINYGVLFRYPKLVDLENTGTAYNYGADFTLEKFFSKGYYGHLAASYFRSFYQASDGIWRNSGNDVRYIVQFIGGKEFKIGKRKLNVITLDFRLHHRGGRPYTPIDLQASIENGEEVRVETDAFGTRSRPYTRFDLKIGGRFNSRNSNLSHYFYLDMINFSDLIASVIFGSNYFKNDLQFKFDPQSESIVKSTQFGLFPIFFYQLQF